MNAVVTPAGATSSPPASPPVDPTAATPPVSDEAVKQAAINDPASATADMTTEGYKRRAQYSFGMAFFCVIAAAFMGFLKTGELATQVATSLIGLAELVTVTFLSVSVVDRSGLLTHLGGRIRYGAPPSQPPQ